MRGYRNRTPESDIRAIDVQILAVIGPGYQLACPGALS